MRILLVYPNRNRYLCPAPIGMLLVGERLRRDGHDVRLLDLMHAKKPAEALTAALRGRQPELVAFSLRNVDNMTMSSLDQPLHDAAELADLTVKICDAPLLIGGSAVTTFPEQTRALLGADYALAGDDLDAFSRFVASVEKGAPDFSTPGLTAEKDGLLIRNPNKPCGYAAARFTGFDRLDLKTYERKGFYACGVVTHSGCPNGCSFCDAHRTFGTEYRLREPRVVVEELTELRRKHRVRSVWLVNSGINRPLEYGKELCARIAEARLGLLFGCIIEPGEFDAELARLLYRAGSSCAMIFGSTLSDAVLERNQPFYRRRDVIEAVRLLRDAKLDYFIGQMYGAPGETTASIEESLELCYQLKPAMILTGYGLRIQPDTPLREIAVREGVIAADDDGFQARFYLADGLTATDVGARIKSFRRRHPRQYVRLLSFVGRSIRQSVFGRPSEEGIIN